MKLFNAHRLASLRTYPPRRILDAIPLDQQWKYKVTPDVVDFIKKTRLHQIDENPARAEHFKNIIASPEKFFSHPQNVPLQHRQQIYLPDFVIKLIRRRKPPRFATFEVPLWFNKLDMKDYLLQAYGVNTIHIRSVVRLQRVFREQKPSRGKIGMKPGSLKRPMSKKRMMVQLEEPFVWPERIKDFSAFEKDTYDAAMKEKQKNADVQQSRMKGIPRHDDESKDSVAEQAKAILRGKTTWKPTWQSIATDMQATTNRPPPP